VAAIVGAVFFQLLGPVEVWRGNSAVRIPGQKARTLLARLLLNVDRIVSLPQLYQVIWGDREPASARALLHNHVSVLRQLLDGGADIVSQADGYLLRLTGAELDAQRFQDEVSGGHAALRDGDPQLAWRRFCAALDLWRGPALTGTTQELRDAFASGLDDKRLTTLADRVDAALMCGRHSEVIAELHGLVADHPRDERLRGQLMLALYRSGRQADALGVYALGRRLLQEQLGIDPGQALEQLHVRILNGDPGLNLSGPSDVESTVDVRQVPVPAQLPASLADFTGRRGQVEELLRLGRRAGAVICVDGMAGIGKTALAVHVGRLLAPDYQDGQLIIDLLGFSPKASPVTPHAALASLLAAFGIPGDRLPQTTEARSGLWRSLTAHRRVLLVLDNAVDAAQVTPLLPAGDSCTLVTTRNRLTSPDGARSLSLDVLDKQDAVELFHRIVGQDRGTGEPLAAEEVVARCGGLPLAIRLAATRLRHRRSWRVADLADRLAADQFALHRLNLGDRSIKAAFSASYCCLSPTDQRVFRSLGMVSGADFHVLLIAAMTATDPDSTLHVLEGLVDLHLLRTSRGGRFHLHDLLRSYAQELAESDIDDAARADLSKRLVHYYLAAGERAIRVLHPARSRPVHTIDIDASWLPATASVDEALGWLDSERPNFAAVISQAIGNGLVRQACELASDLFIYYRNQGHSDEWLVMGKLALAAAHEAADNHAEALMQEIVSVAYRAVGDIALARTHLDRMRILHRASGNRQGEGKALGLLGSVSQRLGDGIAALRYFEASASMLRSVGAEEELMHTSNSHAIALYRRGDMRGAAELFTRALKLAHRLDDMVCKASYLINLGGIELERGDFARSVQYLEEAIEIKRAHGDDRVGMAYNNLAEAWLSTGLVDKAIHYHYLAILNGIQHRDRVLEATARHSLGKTLALTGHAREAFAQHEIAHALARQAGDPHLESAALEGMARCGGDIENHEALHE
jgi:DNA-binding SARP family transcriptional activator